MKALGLYALVAAALVAVVAAVALIVDRAAGPAIAWMGGLAWAVQVVLFLPLVATRGRGKAFFAAWGAGTLARFGVLGLAAWGISRSGVLPIAPSLLALAGFLFALLLMEPMFFRMGLRRQ